MDRASEGAEYAIRNHRPLLVDLCAGEGGWQQPFADHGWRTVGVDIQDMSGVDVLADVRSLPIKPGIRPTLVTASPPCSGFARWMLPWLDEPNPDLSLVQACLTAVETLSPEWWVLENSRGLHQYWRPARTHYGAFYLWGEFPTFDVPASWKGKMQTSGTKPEERAKVPYGLADGLRRGVEYYAAESSPGVSA